MKEDATQQNGELPFFARFLEGQDYPQVKTDVKAGGFGPFKPPYATTQKYPSDGDDDPIGVPN